ncbi:MAG: hypothetical protein ACXWL9_01935, partial [Syntrophales bacterium]
PLEEKFGKWRKPHNLKFNFGIEPVLGIGQMNTSGFRQLPIDVWPNPPMSIIPGESTRRGSNIVPAYLIL